MADGSRRTRRVVLLSGRNEAEAERAEDASSRRPVCGGRLCGARSSRRTSTKGAWLDEVLAGAVALPVDQVQEPFVDVDDIADVVVAALTDDRHVGPALRTDRVRGCSACRDAVAEIGKAAGRDISLRVGADRATTPRCSPNTGCRKRLHLAVEPLVHRGARQQGAIGRRCAARAGDANRGLRGFRPRDRCDRSVDATTRVRPGLAAVEHFSVVGMCCPCRRTIGGDARALGSCSTGRAAALGRPWVSAASRTRRSCPLMTAQAAVTPQVAAQLATANYGCLAGALAGTASSPADSPATAWRASLLVLVGTLAALRSQPTRLNGWGYHEPFTQQVSSRARCGVPRHRRVNSSAGSLLRTTRPTFRAHGASAGDRRRHRPVRRSQAWPGAADRRVADGVVDRGGVRGGADRLRARSMGGNHRSRNRSPSAPKPRAPRSAPRPPLLAILLVSYTLEGIGYIMARARPSSRLSSSGARQAG